MVLWLNARVKAWLDRSATCPLSISLATQPFHLSPIDWALSESPLEVVNLLVGVSRRIRALDLSAGTSTLDPLLRLGPEDLPVLRSIRLQTSTNRKLTEYPDATNVLQIPSLHDISLCVTADALSLPLRWSQLTKLCLECFPIWSPLSVDGGTSAAAMLDILRRCPNLVVCQIKITKDDGLALSSSPITLPNLEILTLGSRYSAECIEFLVLPKLCWLKIGDDDFFPDSGNRSLGRPEYDLTVEIDTGCITLPILLNILQQFPRTSRLYFQSSAGILLDDAFLARLCTPQDALCPMLTNFKVGAFGATFSDAAILAFIRARRNMECSLQKIHIDFGRSVEVDIQPELQSFVSDGMTVDLKYLSFEWKFNPREGLFP
ncbi:hypothetical protein C8R44DRAFT_824187 [Mycena epipterygia]|nr:hypothetical protein C8R44DRAFT_824187 [Mycena epipterygia]